MRILGCAGRPTTQNDDPSVFTVREKVAPRASFHRPAVYVSTASPSARSRRAAGRRSGRGQHACVCSGGVRSRKPGRQFASGFFSNGSAAFATCSSLPIYQIPCLRLVNALSSTSSPCASLSLVSGSAGKTTWRTNFATHRYVDDIVKSPGLAATPRRRNAPRVAANAARPISSVLGNTPAWC